MGITQSPQLVSRPLFISSSPAHDRGTVNVAESVPLMDGAMRPSDPIDIDLATGEIHNAIADDTRDMRRLGRKQELVRNFRSLSILAFVSLATSAWETNLFVFTQGLKDGGRPNVMYSLIWCFVGFIPIYLSMAEMASMAPIAGAQYHWVSEFAPRRYQKILSYITGWMSTLAFQAGNASGMFEVGIIIQAIIAVNVPDYDAPNWHAALINIAFTLFALAANVLGSRMLPHWQTSAFVLHIAAFIAFLVPIWTTLPRVEHELVWTQFENRGGWSSMTLAILVGQMPGISAHVGLDAATHMSEEVNNASLIIPMTMLINFIINMAFIFLTLLSFCYHIPDIDTALNDSTGYPGIWVIRQSISSLPWLNVLLAVILLLEVLGELAYFASVSRDLYAFARDNGLPYSGWLRRVDPRRHIPTNAYIFSASCSILLSLVYIGSSVAFYAIVSLCTVALLQCYLFSISCILWRRIRFPESLPPTKFSLGRWGVPVNASAVAFCLWSFFWTFWPEESPVTIDNLNWAPVLFVATVIVSLGCYVFGGSQKYKGPVALVEEMKTE